MITCDEIFNVLPRCSFKENWITIGRTRINRELKQIFVKDNSNLTTDEIKLMKESFTEYRTIKLIQKISNCLRQSIDVEFND